MAAALVQTFTFSCDGTNILLNGSIISTNIEKMVISLAAKY